MPDNDSITGTTTPSPRPGNIADEPTTAPENSGPTIRYDTLGRAHGADGKLLPRSEAPAKAPGGPGAAGILPSAPGTAHKKIRVKPGKKAVAPERVAQARVRKEIQNQAKETARAITQMMITAVKVSFGDECEPSDKLRERIEEPGVRILERMDPQTSEMVAKYADPLQLTMALAEWGAQILRVLQERRKEKASPETAPTDKPAGEIPESVDRNDGHHSNQLQGEQGIWPPEIDKDLDLSERELPPIRPEELGEMMETRP